MTIQAYTLQELMTRKRRIYRIMGTTPSGSEDHLCASIELDAINAEIRRRERA